MTDSDIELRFGPKAIGFARELRAEYRDQIERYGRWLRRPDLRRQLKASLEDVAVEMADCDPIRTESFLSLASQIIDELLPVESP
jgi:hypothetical protein